MEVVVDTNFAIDLFRLKLLEELKDIEIGKIEIIALSCVLKELEEIAAGRGKDAGYAKLAIDWLRTQKIVECEERVDEAILRIAGEKKIAVATNDKTLRKKLKKLGVKTIYVKSRKYLGME